MNHKDVPIEEAFQKIADKGDVETLQNGTEVAIPKMDTFCTKCFNGLSPVKNISRHKVKKHIYSVKVPGMKELKITEDHSLMVMRDEKLIECRPKDMKKEDKLVVIG